MLHGLPIIYKHILGEQAGVWRQPDNMVEGEDYEWREGTFLSWDMDQETIRLINENERIVVLPMTDVKRRPHDKRTR